MEKVAIIEVYVDETLEDAEECVKEVIHNATWHYLVSDGSVKIEVYKLTNESKGCNYYERCE